MSACESCGSDSSVFTRANMASLCDACWQAQDADFPDNMSWETFFLTVSGLTRMIAEDNLPASTTDALSGFREDLMDAATDARVEGYSNLHLEVLTGPETELVKIATRVALGREVEPNAFAVMQ